MQAELDKRPEDHYKTVELLMTTLDKMNVKYKELNDKYKNALDKSV